MIQYDTKFKINNLFWANDTSHFVLLTRLMLILHTIVKNKHVGIILNLFLGLGPINEFPEKFLRILTFPFPWKIWQILVKLARQNSEYFFQGILKGTHFQKSDNLANLCRHPSIKVYQHFLSCARGSAKFSILFYVI